MTEAVKDSKGPKIIQTNKTSDWRTKPILVKGLFQQAYIGILEELQTKKGRFANLPVAHLAIHEIEAGAKEILGAELTELLNHEAFKAAEVEIGTENMMREVK